MTHLERAIALIEESRQTHLDAIKFLKTLPKKWSPPFTRAWRELDGGVSFHREAIREYEFVLRVLRKCQAEHG